MWKCVSQLISVPGKAFEKGLQFPRCLQKDPSVLKLSYTPFTRLS